MNSSVTATENAPNTQSELERSGVLVTKIADALNEGKSIQWKVFGNTKALGDKFIGYSALRVALDAAFKSRGILVGDIKIDDQHGENIPDMVENLDSYTLAAYLKRGGNIYQALYELFCDVFGVTKNPVIAAIPPIPFSFQEEKNVFSHFDQSLLGETKEKILSLLKLKKNKPIVFIGISGSTPIKRFNRAQEDALTKKFQDQGYQVVVVTDESMKNNDKLKVESLRDRKRVHVHDLQEVSALSQVADVIVLTDSLWDWWIPGSQYFRDDGKKAEIYTLFTVADQRYHVQNTRPIEGQIFKRAREANILDTSGMINDVKYRIQSGYYDALQIVDEDFDIFTKELDEKVLNAK